MPIKSRGSKTEREREHAYEPRRIESTRSGVCAVYRALNESNTTESPCPTRATTRLANALKPVPDECGARLGSSYVPSGKCKLQEEIRGRAVVGHVAAPNRARALIALPPSPLRSSRASSRNVPRSARTSRLISRGKTSASFPLSLSLSLCRKHLDRPRLPIARWWSDNANATRRDWEPSSREWARVQEISECLCLLRIPCSCWDFASRGVANIRKLVFDIRLDATIDDPRVTIFDMIPRREYLSEDPLRSSLRFHQLIRLGAPKSP